MGFHSSSVRFAVGLGLVATLTALCPACTRDGSDPRRAGEGSGRSVAVGFLPDEPRLELAAPIADETRAIDSPLPMSRIVLGAGWSYAEEWGRWTLGNLASFHVLLPEEDPGPRTLTLDCRALDSPQTVAVRVNGEDVGTRDLQVGWAEYRIPIESPPLRSRGNRVELAFQNSRSRTGPGQSDDPRPLAVAFREIALIEEPVADGPVASESGELFVPITTSMGHTVTIGVEPAPGVIERVGFVGSRGTVRDLPPPPPSFDGRLGLAMHGLPGIEPGCLTLQVERPPERVTLLGRSPVAQGARARPGPARVGSRSDAERPDIVILIPDAARADHVGCYGYPKPTTPNIDALADHALVFHNAFSLASYTLCSVPTILTGASFLEHRVEQRGQTLEPGWTTLAESLGEAGYYTVSYTANPNNSRATGADQGFDEFHELWNTSTPADRLDAFRIARLAVERLERGFDARPLFLLIHMVPPHEPYAPPAEYDLFGEPGYRGGYDGSLQTLRDIERGKLDPSAEDMREVVSLYDGNLRLADAAIGRVLDALERRGRWDRTVVLITSDHGEAFGEHGRMGHNSTVNREMLHVPFILRLPDALRDVAADTDALVSLEDVVPTMLALADVEPEAPLSGFDVVSGPDRSQRLLIARAVGERVPLAAWTADRKMIVDPVWGAGLFDPSADPDERHNLIDSHPRTFLCLRWLLDLATEEARPPSTASDERLTEEELETLRSLGYVR